MYPPAWMLADATRLDLDGFGTAFARAWSRMSSRFLKLECWQSYQEQEANSSQAAYQRGDVEAARDLLRREAEQDRPLYADIAHRGIDYARIRLLQEPLTAYLEYELINYRIRADLGEIIEVVVCEPGRRLPDERYFDFLLFDRHTALIHDYGTGPVGHQTGGWLTGDPQVIAALETTAVDLRRRATPLARYLAEV